MLPYKLVTAALVGNVLLQSVAGLWLPYAAKEMVDRVLSPVGPLDPHRGRLALWLILSVAVVIFAMQALVYLFNRQIGRAHV